MQYNEYFKHQDVKTHCYTNQFTELKFLGPQNKPNGVCGLGMHYHMRFDTKLGHVTYEICQIPCDCTLCTSSLDQTWIPHFPAQQQPHYQLVKYFTYWPILG